MTNNHFYDDLNDVKANILEADVISIFFPNFQKSVLVDTRSNDTDGPSIMLTPMARSPRERVKSMEKLRPGFPEVKNMILIPWLRYIFSLEESIKLFEEGIELKEYCEEKLKSAKIKIDKIVKKNKSLSSTEFQ